MGDYQEELWAETEKTEQKKSSKKNKKEKAKQKKAKQEMNLVTFADEMKKEGSTAPNGSKTGIGEQSRSSTVSSESGDKELKSTDDAHRTPEESQNSGTVVEVNNQQGQDENQNQQPAIDFVLYLQQTGS